MAKRNRTDGIRDDDQTFIDWLITEQGQSFANLAQHRGSIRTKLKPAISRYQSAKLETVFTAGLGLSAFVSGVWLGALPGMLLAGAAVAVVSATKFASTTSSLRFASAEQSFLSKNGHLLELLAYMDGQRSGMTYFLVDAYNDFFNEFGLSQLVYVSEEMFLQTLAKMSNAAIGGVNVSNQVLQNISNQQRFELEPAIGEAFNGEADEADFDADLAETEAPKAFVPAFAQKDAADFFAPSPTVNTAPSAVGVATRVVEPTPEPVIDVAKYIVDHLYSYAIIAPSGGGKAILLSNVVRGIKQQRPDMHLFLVDPKNDPREAGYWEGTVDTWKRSNFQSMSGSAKSAWIEAAMREYRDLPAPKLLIMDEATMQFSHMLTDRALHSEAKSFLTAIGSSGNSQENYVFIVGHSGNLSDYGISGGTMSSFRKIYIAPNNNVEAIQQLGLTTFCGGRYGESQVQEILSIAQQSPVNRAVYIGALNKWQPMERMPNHSGFDRDNRTAIPGSGGLTNADNAALFAHALVQTFVEPPEIEPDLHLKMQAVYGYIKNKDHPVDRRTIQQATMTALQGMSSELIQALLDEMVSLLFLTVQGSFYYYNPNKTP